MSNLPRGIIRYHGFALLINSRIAKGCAPDTVTMDRALWYVDRRVILESSFHMSKKNKKLSLRDLSRLPMNKQTYFKELIGGSDHACAMLAGAAISEGLGDLLKLYFIKLEKDDTERLFHGQGAPLGDFSSRTSVSFALGLITPQERLAATVVRKIRNHFAHTLDQFDFSNELIIAELRKVWPGKRSPDKDPKMFFINMSLALYLALNVRRDDLAKQRSRLPHVPLYQQVKHGRGMFPPKVQ